MTELSPTRLWLMRGAFALTALTILFCQLLPLQTTPRAWAGPDLLLCFALAWSLRRPEYVPAPLLAGVLLLADLLLQRPPGLLALLALIGCENMKYQARGLRDSNFFAEWITAGLILMAIVLGERLVLAVLLINVPSLTLTLSGLGLTILCYPLIVAVSHFFMGVRKASAGELDPLGQRL